jgi:5-methylcytosine-specific restriction endonuclease McrA
MTRHIQELLDFLVKDMRMSEVYQPAIILYLLEQDGCASSSELARVLSGYDPSVQEYYTKILMRWPKITLSKHDVISYDHKRKEFCLNFELDDPESVEQAKQICERKIEQWIEQQATSEGGARVEASVRYRVLKAARGKCELCGISSKLTPIDIDHIVPQSKADGHGYVVKDGIRIHKDDERNLQALCFQCNRAKRDQDATDFRLPQPKLVRDQIPNAIIASGRQPIVKQVRGQRYRELLFD